MSSSKSSADDEAYMRFVPKEFSKAPIANKDDWASLFNVLRDQTAWTLPSGDQKQGSSGAPQVVTGGSGVVASLTHGSQSLTREVLHKRLLADTVQVQGSSNGSVDPKSTYEISLDGLRLCNLGVNTSTKGSKKSDISDSERKQFLEIARTSALAEFREVRKLTVNNNKIEDALSVEVLLSCLPELRELQLDFNSLNRIPSLSALPKLEQLTIVNNQMAMAGDSLASLKLNTLDLTTNRLTVLPSTLRLPMLTTLTLRNNAFTTLDSLSSLTHLTSLDVSFNQLNSLAGIDTMVNLQELLASDNQLRSSALQAHKNPLRALAAKLESLDLSNNRISSLGFFPSSGFPKLWNLNLAHNAFHGEKSARPEPGTPPPASKATSETSRSGRLGQPKQKKGAKNKKRSNLGFSDSESSASSDLTDGLGDLDDDFGESLYGDDDAAPTGDSPSKSSAKTSISKTNPGQGSKTTPSFTKPGGKKTLVNSSSSVSSTTAGASKTVRPSSTSVSIAAKSNTTSKKPSTPPMEPEVSFLTKVTTLFPALEALDVSNNSSDLIPEYSELTTLSKVSTLSELGISGTLDMGPTREKQHKEAIQAFLPDIRVIDGSELEGAKKPEVTDMTSGSSRPTSAAARPMSAAGLRPTSAIRKTTTVRKKELNEFRDQLVGFLNDAAKTREKCNNVIDFLDASVAWAFEGQDMPDEETYLKYGKSGKAAAAAKEEAQALDDLEKQLKCDETMAAVRVHQEKKAQDSKNSPTKSVASAARAQSSSSVVRQPSSSQRALVARKPPGEGNSSPGSKARLRASSSHSQISAARSQGRAMSVTSSNLGEKTRAMDKIQKERTLMRPSFASEQKKFRESAKKESEDRLRQILELTGNNRAQEVVQKHKKKVAEAGTTMESPDKASITQASSRPPSSHQPPALSDDELLRKTESFLTRAMSSGGEKVSAGVGTSPPKASVPTLAIKGSEADRSGNDKGSIVTSTTTAGPENETQERDFEEALEDVLAQDDLDPKVKQILLQERERRQQLIAAEDDEDEFGDDDDDGLLMHVTGDPRFMETQNSSGMSPTTPVAASNPMPLKKDSVRGEVLRPSSASIKQRQEMGKSHRRLGEGPRVQESDNSTAVPHTSMVLSRYETGGPGKFSLKDEIKKGASGWSSANAQMESSSTQERPSSSKSGGVISGSRVLQPKHRVSNNTGGLLVKGGKSAEEEKKPGGVAPSVQRKPSSGTSLNRRQR